jgi:hypothetical protein
LLWFGAELGDALNMSSSADCDPKPLPTDTFEQGASSEEPRCSVKEAARRMQKNPSTIYRMRRRPGPLRFVLDGRRIYIELESLETFLSCDVSNLATLETTPPEGPDKCIPAIDEKNQNDDSRDQREDRVEVAGRSGQRALILPPKKLCLAILYSF